MAVATSCRPLSAPWPARVRAMLLFGAVLCWPSFAAAHEIGLSRGVYQKTEDGVRVELTLARGEVEAALPSLERNRQAGVESGGLELWRAELGKWFATNLEIKSGSASCAGTLERAALTEQDGLRVELRYRCPFGAQNADVALGFLTQLSFGHRHTTQIVSGSSIRDEIFFRNQSKFAVPAVKPHPAAAGSSAPTRRGFVSMGLEHILTGYDHVVFLLALGLTASRIGSLLWVVTAFTLGHSLSLALVVFGVIAPPAAWVEPAIALSVACVGIENLFRQRSGIKRPDRRWRLTLPFGLIHGLGFASALTEASVPRAELPAALLTFNLGVELGQLALLALFLPLVLRLERTPWFAHRAVPVLSIAVIVAGGVWFVERLGT